MTARYAKLFLGHNPTSASGNLGAAGGLFTIEDHFARVKEEIWPSFPIPLPEAWTDAKLYVSYDTTINDLKNSTTPTGTPPTIDQNTNSDQTDGKFGLGHAEFGSSNNTMYVLFASDFGANKTYEAWLRFDDNGNTTVSNFGTAGDVVLNAGDGFTLVVNTATDKLELKVGSTSIATTGAFTKGTWKHIAIAVEGTTIRLYENGVQKGSGTAPSSYNNGFHVGQGNSTFHIDDLLMSDIVRYPSGNAFTPPDVHPTFDTSGVPLITNLHDGDGGDYREYVVTELFSLPPGATGYRFALSGNTLSGYSGRTMFCQNPANNTNFHIGAGAPVNNPPQDTTLTSPSTSGTFGAGGTNTTRIHFRKYNDVFYAWVFAPNGNGDSQINISVRAIDSNNNFVGAESNTITGVIDEDG